MCDGRIFSARRKIYNLITTCYEVIAMDFFDDDFFDGIEDFAFIGGLWGLIEEEYDEEERLRRELEEDPDDYYYS